MGMGASFQFVAKNSVTGKLTQVEVFVGGVAKGFTTTNPNQRLLVELDISGTFDWHAKKSGKVVDKGHSSGGNIIVYVDPRNL